jgi:hypothetical protein
MCVMRIVFFSPYIIFLSEKKFHGMEKTTRTTLITRRLCPKETQRAARGGPPPWLNALEIENV